MKKNRFLKGMSAAFALALVALATTFTSCEKENFNVEVTTPDATATISPIVLYVDADGNVSDVTSLAVISGNKTYTGQTISAQTVTVTATYNGLTGSETVEIPELSAGENFYATPIIWLNESPYEYSISVEEDPDSSEDLLDLDPVQNTTNYWWNTSRTYIWKGGITEATATAVSTDADDQSYLNNVVTSIVETYYKEERTIEFIVYAHSQTELEVLYNKTNVTLTITKTVDDSTENVGTVTYSSYAGTQVNVTVNQSIPGHSYNPSGYGHGHGDDPNAGGGIMQAD